MQFLKKLSLISASLFLSILGMESADPKGEKIEFVNSLTFANGEYIQSFYEPSENKVYIQIVDQNKAVKNHRWAFFCSKNEYPSVTKITPLGFAEVSGDSYSVAFLAKVNWENDLLIVLKFENDLVKEIGMRNTDPGNEYLQVEFYESYKDHMKQLFAKALMRQGNTYRQAVHKLIFSEKHTTERWKIIKEWTETPGR